MKIEKLLQLAEVTFRKQSNLDSEQSPNVLWCVHAREHYLHVLYPVSQVRFTVKLKERNILARLHYKARGEPFTAMQNRDNTSNFLGSHACAEQIKNESSAPTKRRSERSSASINFVTYMHKAAR
jgi:hypothetical protein